MYIVILLIKFVSFFCSCIRSKSYSFVNLPSIHTQYGSLSVNLFEKEEIEAVNRRVVVVHEKPPPIYNRNDPLSQFRIQNFKKTTDSPDLNLSSLPYVQIEHQDKNKLVKFKDGREILSFYANKLNTFLANYVEWNKAYDSEQNIFDRLDLYNPIAPNTYYAVVYYCCWQSESIALVRAIKQLLGKYYFKRDPPIIHEKKKKKVRMKEVIDEMHRIQDMIKQYRKDLEYAKANNLPPPPDPIHPLPVQVTFNLDIPDVEETLKILDFCKKKYSFNWWMPEFATLTYNSIVDKAFNEVYNTTYKSVVTPEDRNKYKLMDLKRIIPPKADKSPRPININFILVRLANSMMISNATQGVKRHRRFIQSHEKEFRFNEIMLRLLLDQQIYYENMPAIQLFKCRESLDAIPSVYGNKSSESMPFDKHLSFYKKNPFEIAAHVNYGLPNLRKCNHLSVMDDFVHLGNFMDIGSLKTIDAFDDLFAPNSDFLSILTKNANMTGEDMARIEPVLQTLTLMYKYHLRKIIDARPKPTEYIILNP